jgi:predicted TIM-barrel fold metal-dependent hydrolase
MIGSTRVIDCQFHWHPPALCEHDLGRADYPRATRVEDGYRYELSAVETQHFTARFSDLDTQLADAAAAGVDVVVSGPSASGDVGGRADLGEAVEVATLLNEEAARAQQTSDGRLIGIAVLPMQDLDAALGVLDHAIGTLGLRGVCVYSNIGGASIAQPALRPLYERIEQLDVPILLHPTGCFRDERVAPFQMERPLGYMFDSSFAVLSLIVGGILDACPDLRVLHPHLGGTLPFLAERMEMYRRGGLWPDMTEPIATYLRRLYFDTASFTPGALALTRQVGDESRLVFGSDYPYWPITEGLAFIRDNLPEELFHAVCQSNAERLLGLSADVSSRSAQ